MLMVKPIPTLLNQIVVVCLLLGLPASAGAQQPQETAEQVVERVKKAIENDEWGRAKHGLRLARQLKPESAESHYLSAQVYLQEGARSMAIDSLMKAIEYQPIFPEAHFLLAQCLMKAGKPDKASEVLNAAIVQGTLLFPAYRLLAEIDLTRGDFEAAATSLETALRFAPSGDSEDVAKVREQLEQAREFAEKLKRFAVFEAGQKARLK